MNKQSATVLMKKAVKAFNEGDADFQSIMDTASVHLNDEQWAELERLLNEANQTPVLPETLEQEQVRLEETVARLRQELDEAETRLNGFYALKHSRRRSKS